MLELAKLDREQLISGLGLGRRLATRVGALLSERIACTVTLLETAAQMPKLEMLLLRKELTNTNGDLAQALASLLALPDFAGLAQELPLVVADAGDGWRAIALQEELAAEEGFSNQAQQPSQTFAAPALIKNQALAEQSRRGHASFGDSSQSDNDLDLEKLRIAVFAGTTSQERVAALRKLAFINLGNKNDDARRLDIFLQAAAADDAALRAAAAAGLRVFGLSDDVAEALRLLAEGDAGERAYACSRLLGCREDLSFEARAACMGVMGLLRGEATPELRSSALEVLGKLAPRLEDFPARLGDVLRLVIEQVAAHPGKLAAPARQALYKIDRQRPGLLFPLLMEEAGRTAQLEMRAFVIGCAASCKGEPELLPRLRSAAADCLVALPAEAWQSHTLAGYLVDSGDAGVTEMLDRMPGLDTAHQRFFLRSLDNAARFRQLSQPVRIRLAEALLTLLRQGEWYLRADIYETRLVADSVPAELKCSLATELLRDLHRFRLPQVHDSAASCIAALGAAVVKPLVEVIKERSSNLDGKVACCALGMIAGELASFSKPADIAAEILADLREAMRMLQGMTFSKKAVAPEIYSTLGRFCACKIAGADARGVVRRNLSGRLTGEIADAPLLDALGWIASCPEEEDITRREVAAIALSHISHEVDIGQVEIKTASNGEEFLQVGAGFAHYSELIPAALGALSHILLCEAVDPKLLDEIASKLLAKWLECAAFAIQWSPANIMQLTQILGQAGGLPSLEKDRRREIAHALAKRASDIPTLEALSSILAGHDNDEELDRLATGGCQYVIKHLREEEELAEEDREVYLRILGRLVSRGRTAGKDGLRVMENAVDEIVSGMRSGLLGCLSCLSNLEANGLLPKKLRERIATEINLHASLVRS